MVRKLFPIFIVLEDEKIEKKLGLIDRQNWIFERNQFFIIKKEKEAERIKSSIGIS